MKVVNCVVLVNDGPTSRAYVKYMFQSGYMPKKISLMNFKVDRGIKTKIVGRLFGQRFLQKLIAIKIGRMDQDDWKIYHSLFDAGDEVNLAESVCYRDYSIEYDEILIDHINDMALKDYLKKEDSPVFIFTGGGLLNQDILDIPHKKFIHMHPGIVPQIRGTDGLFWSLLLRGKPGISCFYMDAGIDTGDVLHKKEFEPPKLKEDISDIDCNVIRRVLLKFYDPKLRALTLVSLIKELDDNGIDLGRVQALPQNSGGRTYFSMHEALLRKTLSKLMVHSF